MKDKLIVVYEGSYAQYRGDWLKDEYVNKLVIVTGEQSSTSAEARKSYLCVSNGEKSVAIPIPSVYLQGIMVDGARYGYTDGYIRFAKANGIDLSFDAKTGNLNIGISEELSTQLATLIDTIDTVSKTADGAVETANLANITALGAVNTADKASAKATEVEAKAESAATTAEEAKTMAAEAISKPNIKAYNASALTVQGYVSNIITNDAKPPVITSSSSVLSTEALRCGKKIKGRAWLGGNQYTNYNIWFLDINGNVFTREIVSTISGVQDFEVEVPDGAIYFIVCTLSSQASVFSCTTDVQSLIEEGGILAQKNNLIIRAGGDVYSSSRYMTSSYYANISVTGLPPSDLFYVKVEFAETISIEVKDTSGNILNSGKTNEWISVKRVATLNDTLIIRTTSSSGGELREYIISTKTASPDSSLDLTNRNILFIGDSITEFKYSGQGWVDYFARITGARCFNVAIGGSQIRQRMSPSTEPISTNQAYAALDMWNIVKAMIDKNYTMQRAAATMIAENGGRDYSAQIATLENVDLNDIHAIIIFGGTNDWYNGENSWGWDDPNRTNPTYTCGAINEIQRVINQNYPNIQVCWVTPIVRFVDTNNRTPENFGDNYVKKDMTLEQWTNRMVEQVVKHKTPIYDAYHSLGWNMWNFNRFFLDTDATHPFTGFEWLANKIAHWFATQRAF